jgi:MFS family permease
VRGFWQFSISAFFIHVGVGAQRVAISWDIYNRTDSALLLGIVGLVQAVPMFLMTLPAGYLADVYDRKKIMLIGLIGTTLTSIALGVFSIMQGSVPIMFVLLFFDAAFQRLASPARSTIIPLMVPPEKLENAIKWRTSLSQISSVAGPAAGGLLVAASASAAYFFSAATTTLFCLVVVSLVLPESKQSHPGRMFAQLREGLSFVWNQRLILGSISLDMAAVLLGGATFLLPVYAKDILRIPNGMKPEHMLGILQAAPAVGAITMALTLAHLPPMRKAGRKMLWSVAAFGLAIIGFGLAKSFWVAFAMLFLTGLFDNISVVVRHTLVQLRTPNELRGRVSAVNTIFIGSSNDLGGFESGLVANWFGAVVSVVSGGIGTLLVVATWARLFPSLRRFDELK